MSSSTAWWAQSKTRARLTTAGAGAIVVALSATSFFVWTSPSNPVTQAVTRAAVSVIDAGELESERDDLASKLSSLQARFARNSGQATDLRAQLDTMQQKLDEANAALADARAAAESAQAQAAAPSPPSSGTRATAAPSKPSTTPSGIESTSPTVTAPSKAQLAAPDSRLYGMYTAQAPFNWATYDDTSSKVGSRPNVVGYFGGWDESFRASAVTRAWQRNTMPILTWESRPIAAGNDVVVEPDYELSKIIGDPATGVAGSFDDYLRQYARDIVATGLPLGIRLDHEMNGNWYPWAEGVNGNSRGEFVQMWQHVHDIFEAEGANQLVVWIWSPNIVNNLPSANKPFEYLQSLYPGDAYVDWVGLSGYMRPPYKTDQTFTFDYTFGPSLNQLRQITSKPIFLAEIGASETGGHKTEWVTSFFDGLARPENADVIGFAWFNLAVTGYVEGQRATNDWRIDSRADSLAAFRDGLADAVNDFALSPY